MLSYFRISSFFGPIRASITKMFNIILQFIIIFAFVMFAFALGLSKLYGFHASKILTTAWSSNDTEINQCQTVAFQSFEISLQTLFWIIFGKLEEDCVLISNDRPFVDIIGVALVVVYNITVIFILLQMLTALIVDSFSSTNKNKDVEWKFHRMKFWIPILRRKQPRPPPFNLIPNFALRYIKIRYFWKKNCNCLCSSNYIDENAKSYLETCDNTYLTCSQSLLNRYRKKHFKVKEEKIMPCLNDAHDLFQVCMITILFKINKPFNRSLLLKNYLCSIYDII